MLVIAIVFSTGLIYAWFLMNEGAGVSGFDQQVIALAEISLGMEVDGSEVATMDFNNAGNGQIYRVAFKMKNNGSSPALPKLTFSNITAQFFDVNGDGIDDTSLLDVFAIDLNPDNSDTGINMNEIGYIADLINSEGVINVYAPTAESDKIPAGQEYIKIIYVIFAETPRNGVVFNDINDYQNKTFKIGKIQVDVR